MKNLVITPLSSLPQERGTFLFPADGGGLSLEHIAESPGRYLHLNVTVHETHSLVMELRVWDASQEEAKVIIRFGLLPQLKTPVTLDLHWLDGHILFPGHTPGLLKVVCHGSRVQRDEITRCELVTMPCFHDVRVTLEDITLDDVPASPAPITATPVIDRFGRYLPHLKADEPIRDESDLQKALHREADLPDAWPFPFQDQYGGDTRRKIAEPTGFFTTARVDGRYHLADPLGHLFFSAGLDCVVARSDARVDGLESMCSWLPATDDPAFGAMYRVPERPFGEEKTPAKLFSFEQANLRRAFGDGWRKAWEDMILRQLKHLGFNSLGNWSDPALFGHFPYVWSLPAFPDTKHHIFRDFPDVMSPEYEESARENAKALHERATDPYMIGYFLRNEPSWAFVDNLVLADEVLRDPADTCTKRALIESLRGQYGTVQSLNLAWNTSLASFDDLLTPLPRASALSPAALRDLRAFSRRMIETYVAVPSRYCRQTDPNHLNLGMRWAWISDPLVVSGWEHMDVFSINCYAHAPTRMLDQVQSLGVDRPVVIGEFHFGALDGGLPGTGLEAVRTQEDRGIAYRCYLEQAAAHPLCVGSHYFQCYDQFALGRFDGENYNIGLFDVCLLPHTPMTDLVRACHEGILDVKEGRVAPSSHFPESIPMIAY
ncbi:MAG: beta-galactosidase [Clostridia bacterium]|nr:beta-galactosidase [Clostridia bacterium]